MADQVVDYMNEHGKAPDSINYNGATIGYYDLVYNFALLTQDDTSASNMNFPSEMGFHKYYSNFINDILPIGIILIAIILILVIIRKIRRRIRRRKERRYAKKRQREMQKRTPRRFHKSVDSRYYSDYDYPPNRPRRLDRQERRRR